MAGPQLTPFPTIPGDFDVVNQQASDIKYNFIGKQEAFTVMVNGLMPSTRHYVFFDKKKVAAANIKPLNGNVGDPIFSDTNGYAEFIFYYTSAIQSATTENTYSEIAERISGDKELVVANSDGNLEVLPDAYNVVFSSFAAKLIFFKTTKVTELPVKAAYSFAYLPYTVIRDDSGGGGGDGGTGGSDTGSSSSSGAGSGDE